MCDCRLIVEDRPREPIQIADELHTFLYCRDGKEHVLLRDIKMHGVISYAACHEIEGKFGVKRGYMFVIGEAV